MTDKAHPQEKEQCPPDTLRAECILAIQLAVNEGMTKAIEPVHTMTSELYNRMFVDNGKESVQTCLKKLEPIYDDLQALKSMRFQLRLQWAVMACISLAFLGIIKWAIQSGVAKVMAHILAGG